MKKRALCWMLVLVMVLSLLPTFALNAAAATTAYEAFDKTDWTAAEIASGNTAFLPAGVTANDTNIYYKDSYSGNYYPVRACGLTQVASASNPLDFNETNFPKQNYVQKIKIRSDLKNTDVDAEIYRSDFVVITGGTELHSLYYGFYDHSWMDYYEYFPFYYDAEDDRQDLMSDTDLGYYTAPNDFNENVELFGKSRYFNYDGWLKYNGTGYNHDAGDCNALKYDLYRFNDSAATKNLIYYADSNADTGRVLLAYDASGASASLANVTLYYKATMEESSITASSTDITVEMDDIATVNLTFAGCEYANAVSADTNVANVSYENGVLTITPVSVDNTTITVSGNALPNHFKPADLVINVTVNPNGYTAPVLVPGENGTYADNAGDTSGMFLSKKLEPQPDGTYTITMDAYATGETVTEGTGKPTDIILVLDQSGSMGDSISYRTGYDSISQVKYDSLDSKPNDYFIKVGDEYYQLYYYREETPRQEGDWGLTTVYNYWWWYGDPDRNSPNAHMIVDCWYRYNTLKASECGVDLYQAKYTSTSRLVALRSALNEFLGSIAEKEGDFRIGLVGFTNQNYGSSQGGNNSEIFNGYDSTSIKNLDPNENYYNYAMKEAGSDDLLHSVSTLTDEGGTKPDDGFMLVQRILDDREKLDDYKDRDVVIVFFTDGEPDDVEYGEDAINIAHTLKDTGEEGYGATIYSIGVFAGGDETHIDSYDDDSPTIREFMKYVSSDYPYAESFENHGNENPNGTGYYQMVAGTKSLADIFDDVSQDVSGTSVTLDEHSVLRDGVNTENFTAPQDANIKVYTVSAERATNTSDVTETGNWTEDTAHVYPVTNQNGVVSVTNFDYHNQYIAPGHPGQKIRVVISGLLPLQASDPSPEAEGKLPSNRFDPATDVAGIYKNSDAPRPTVKVNVPWTTIAERTVMLDYDMTYELANGQYAKLSGTPTHTYGTFTAANEKVTYKLDTGKIAGMTGSTVDLAFNGVDTALVYGNQTDTNTTSWKKVNVIPASCIYYDDSLSEVSGTTDGSSNSSLVIPTQGDTDELSRGKHTFTFYGTGIDVYCTTYDTIGEGESATKVGTIQAKLIKPDGTVYENMYNYSPEMRYNVPTVFFHDLPLGNYTLVLSALSSSNYLIDGIRIYNPMADQTLYDETKDEQYAAYVNLRDALVNNPDTNIETSTVEGGLDGVNIEQTTTTGVLFVDDPQMLHPKEVQEVDLKTGKPVYEADGTTPKMTKVYESTFASYKDLGPKNEIYLDAGQAITFTLTSTANGGNLWLGLSAPNADETTGEVLVNEDTANKITVTSAMDMYYPITKNSTGSYTIKNNGTTLIAITNLKITGVQSIYEVAAAGQPAPQGNGGEEGQNANPGAAVASVEDVMNMVFEPVTMRTVKLAANNGVDPDAVVTPDPEPDPEPEKPGWDDNAYNPVNLLKTLFKLLLQSLGNLFSGLGNW